jgi:hypothetical protein
MGCLLGCCALLPGRSSPTFQRCCLHHQSDDDGGSKHLWNVDRLLQGNTAQQPRRQPSPVIYFRACFCLSLISGIIDPWSLIIFRERAYIEPHKYLFHIHPSCVNAKDGGRSENGSTSLLVVVYAMLAASSRSGKVVCGGSRTVHNRYAGNYRIFDQEGNPWLLHLMESMNRMTSWERVAGDCHIHRMEKAPSIQRNSEDQRGRNHPLKRSSDDVNGSVMHVTEGVVLTRWPGSVCTLVP